MATCPHCHGHLTEGHRCRRTRRSLYIELFGTALIGGLAAITFVAVYDPHQVTVDLDGMVFAAGAILALGVHQALMWRPKKK